MVLAVLARQHIWETIDMSPELWAFLTTNSAALLVILREQMIRRTVPQDTLTTVQSTHVAVQDLTAKFDLHVKEGHH